MRLSGTLRSWNDDRGFGFIAPTHGGAELFVHISALPRGGSRPTVGEKVTYELGRGKNGKPQATSVQREAIGAKAVEPLRPLRPSRAHASRSDGSAQWGTASYFAILGFVAIYFGATVFWRVPAWVMGAYGIASVVSFLAYAQDKSAAVANRWRVSESTLLTLGILGGWPGSIIAQQLLRHKSSKASFRSKFWSTVALNILAFLFFVAPIAKHLSVK